MQKFFLFVLNLLVVVFLLSPLPGFAQPGEQVFIMEGHPDTIQAHLTDAIGEEPFHSAIHYRH